MADFTAFGWLGWGVEWVVKAMLGILEVSRLQELAVGLFSAKLEDLSCASGRGTGVSGDMCSPL